MTHKDRMAKIRFFHEVDGNVRELPDRETFRYERKLQEFFEKHLPTLTGVEFLASEYWTGKRHGGRIDTLGIDGAGRPVVIEYKRRLDENVINQGLHYVAWLEDHQAEFRELVREKLGEGRSTGVDFRTPRLLCIAGEFPRQDRTAAENSRRRVELLRYRRYGDDYVALEWVHGGELIDPAPKPAGPPRQTIGEEPGSIAPQPSSPSAPGTSGDSDYSAYQDWGKASEECRTLFRELKTLVDQLGSVRTKAFKTLIAFQCMSAAGNRERVIASTELYVRWVRLRVLIIEKHLRDIPLEDGFTRRVESGKYREIVIRDREQIRRAEPLLRTAYDRLSRSGS